MGWVVCPHCGAYMINSPPHGEGQPCPEKEKERLAYVDMLDAQKLYYLNAAMASGDSGQSMKELTGVFRKMIGGNDE